MQGSECSLDSDVSSWHDKLHRLHDADRDIARVAICQRGELVVVGWGGGHLDGVTFLGLGSTDFYRSVGDLGHVDSVVSRSGRSGNIAGFVEIHVELTCTVAGER